jgi:cation transport protein ChaC
LPGFSESFFGPRPVNPAAAKRFENMLTREDLENDVLRKSFERVRHQVTLLSVDEFHASLERILDDWNSRRDLWVFGYGSLIWNPLLRFVDRRLASIHGYHRCFCLHSRLGRGSVEQPGLVLGLDFGGCCKGVAFRIAAADARHELMLTWRREMVLGSYAPRWVTVRSGDRQLRAIAFIVNHAHPHYTGKLPLKTIIATLASAHGKFGAGSDYLYKTVDCLASNGIHDTHLAQLRDQVALAAHGVHHAVECPEVGA